VGEDGRINLLTAQQSHVIRTIGKLSSYSCNDFCICIKIFHFYISLDEADSCSLYCVDFLRHSEILTGNIRGHMKVWDLRSEHDTPATTIMLSEQSKVMIVINYILK
jgi:nuclear pore complex protein Nup43